MSDPIYELSENPVYNETIRAIQDSDPALASAIFTPLFTAMLNNTHFVKRLAEQVAAELAGHAQNKDNPHGVTAEQVGAVPTQRKVNGKPLSADITLSAADVGALAASRVLNNISEIWGPDATPLVIGVDEELIINVHGTNVLKAKVDTATVKSIITFSATAVNGIPTPIGPTDATNKQYVDSKMLVFTNITVPVSSWYSNSTYSGQGYNWQTVVDCQGVTSLHRPDVTFDVADAVSGNFAPVAETFTDGMFIYCKTLPTAAVAIPSIVCIKGA